MSIASYRNSVLRSLSAAAIERLHLRKVEFEVEHELEFPGQPIRHLFFVETGMASMTTTFRDGGQVEVGMFGYESIIGVSALMGSIRSLNRVYTQIEGHGYSSPLSAAKQEFELGGEFQSLCLRYVQTQLLQALQSAGCNATHSFEQRLSRWLLICSDRAGSDTFKMSHQFLSDMLGNTRSTVSITAAQLKHEKLIDYSRGVIRILDPAGLEKRACECYEVIKDHLDNYTEFDSGVVASRQLRPATRPDVAYGGSD
jgi:CRP-like cAMP-binding protein